LNFQLRASSLYIVFGADEAKESKRLVFLNGPRATEDIHLQFIFKFGKIEYPGKYSGQFYLWIYLRLSGGDWRKLPFSEREFTN